MQHTLQLTLTPEQAATPDKLKAIAAGKLNLASRRITEIQILRKTIDARSRQPKVVMEIRVFVDEKPVLTKPDYICYQDVSDNKEVIIVGAGPAGLFAALRLIELGLRPIILERGKEVSERKRDIAAANRNDSLNPESNYCFGEGGAGTFSDGKLYTRSKKKGNIRRILDIFHLHGAQDEVLYEAHPHIGSDRLPEVIRNMRNTILHSGGEVHFNTRVNGFLLGKDNCVEGVETASGETFRADAVILATGHSARDVYELLHEKNIEIEAKGFAMGVRVEHPQQLIDSIQYHARERDAYLPAAAYSLVAQADGRGVYSFCMCPGGHIVPASTAVGEVVVNGMSSSQRNSPYANSGIVVEIRPEDLEEEWQQYGALAGLRFQQYVEQLAFRNNGGQGLKAPAQRLGDFVYGRLSSDLPECSYLPGLISSPLHFWLPEIIGKRLREGFRAFDRKMHGFVSNEAVVVGVESRSSSPVRIPRDADTGQHIRIRGLFPCGEGAGYAGGITSSAMDGEKTAEKVAEFYS
ncbi:MAG: FAD-binding protein [Prevotellaceae bacterium]|nr:FAD-binding protein [Prevotellaceae bacterium]